jgi:hypothetical protein
MAKVQEGNVASNEWEWMTARKKQKWKWKKRRKRKKVGRGLDCFPATKKLPSCESDAWKIELN